MDYKAKLYLLRTSALHACWVHYTRGDHDHTLCPVRELYDADLCEWIGSITE